MFQRVTVDVINEPDQVIFTGNLYALKGSVKQVAVPLVFCIKLYGINGEKSGELCLNDFVNGDEFLLQGV